jgi:ABC-type amino acid transport substrate-binding protein
MRLKFYLVFAYTKKGTEMARIFDDEFAQLLASGKLKKLYAKWEFEPFPFE